LFSQFFGKCFSRDFFPKHFCGVFELPLLRNAQKRHLKKFKKNQGTYLPHLAVFWQIYIASNNFSLKHPLIRPEKKIKKNRRADSLLLWPLSGFGPNRNGIKTPEDGGPRTGEIGAP
jgi:hypothetical protein